MIETENPDDTLACGHQKARKTRLIRHFAFTRREDQNFLAGIGRPPVHEKNLHDNCTRVGILNQLGFCA